MKTAYLVASGDLRMAANQSGEAAQMAMERQLTIAVERLGAVIHRAHAYDPQKRHGFIDSQRYGIEVFRAIPSTAPLIVAEAVWQYSHHLLAGLLSHRGAILTIANWSGTWPGLVGLLNLNACLTKAGVRYSSLWSEDFADPFFTQGLERWLGGEAIVHDTSHVRKYEAVDTLDSAPGIEVARDLVNQKAIMGVFDEGCLGMYNAIIPDELLFPLGVFKERVSQSALYAKMQTIPDSEARAVYDWLIGKGMRFNLGKNDATELTVAQVLEQCRMYIAAIRIADQFGCDTIGIPNQQGLKDIVPASDLAEGLLNNVERPPVHREQTGEPLYAGEALPHFNQVDECAGLDGLITYRLWRKLGFPPETTLHDLRWGRHFTGQDRDEFVWVLQISGAAPPAHFVNGYRSATSERQPSVCFPQGGGTIKGVSRPGWVVWSRVFVEQGTLGCDLGLGEAVRLPVAETEERWRLTTPQWPIMHLALKGIRRDQMMARHRSNHIQVVYAPSREGARTGLFAKAAAMRTLGLKVYICGEV